MKYLLIFIFYLSFIFPKTLHAAANTEEPNVNNDSNEIRILRTEEVSEEEEKLAKLIISCHASVNLTKIIFDDAFNGSYFGLQVDIDSIFTVTGKLNFAVQYFFNDYIGIRSGFSLLYIHGKSHGTASIPAVATMELDTVFDNFSLYIPIAPIVRFLGLYIYGGVLLNISLYSKVVAEVTSSIGVPPFNKLEVKHSGRLDAGFIFNFGGMPNPKGKVRIRGDISFFYIKYKKNDSEMRIWSITLGISLLYGK